ncbi:MAG: ABC transporter ATP-binding protein, partial [Chloroflexota bacterium]
PEQRRGPGGRGRERLDFKTLGRAIAYIPRYREIAILAYGSLVVATAAQLMVPQLIQSIIDTLVTGFTGGQAPGLAGTILRLPSVHGQASQGLVVAMLAIVVFAAARAIFSFGQGYNSERLSQNVAFDFRNDLFSTIQRLSFSYHDRNQTGQLMIRATDDVEKVRLFLGQGLTISLQAIVLLISTLIILWATNPALTLVILPILPIAFLAFFGFGAIAQPLFIQVQMRIGALNTVLQENLAGLKVVRAFAREPREIDRFTRAADDLVARQIVIAQTFSFLFPIIFLLSNLGQAAVLYFGGRQIIDGTLTLGDWQKFSLYLSYLFFPIGQLGFIINLMAQASASAQRVFEILDTKNEIENRPGAMTLDDVTGRVDFDDVTFRYFKGGDPVLSQVSFTAEPGQTVALLGATGSGKTTIINLIPRFYEVSEGGVTIDGNDVRDVTIESLRSQIGIVLQETTLFTGTIRDNIAYGRPKASLDEVVAAARAAAAHEFIVEFPEGYDTPVGERGSTLSGGQK